jgi:hypothetical protein
MSDADCGPLVHWLGFAKTAALIIPSVTDHIYSRSLQNESQSDVPPDDAECRKRGHFDQFPLLPLSARYWFR